MPTEISTAHEKEIFDELSNYLSNLIFISESKAKLYASYQDLIEYLAEELPEFDQQEFINSFPTSLKLPTLLTEAIIIYGAISGAISTILPELITQGLLITSFATFACITFIAPACVSLPFFFYQMSQDICQEQRTLRIEELTLHAQKHIIEKIYREKHNHLLEININHRQVKIDFLEEWNLSKEIGLDATYLFLTFFALGIAIFITFSLSNPLNWALITIAGATLGILYSLLQVNQKRKNVKKRCELNHLRTQIQDLSTSLFIDEERVKKQIEIDNLNLALTEKEDNVDKLDLELAEKQKEVESLKSQLEEEKAKSKKYASSPLLLFSPASNDSTVIPAPTPRSASR